MAMSLTVFTVVLAYQSKVSHRFGEIGIKEGYVINGTLFHWPSDALCLMIIGHAEHKAVRW